MTIENFGDSKFNPDFVFSSQHFEEHKISDDDLIKLVPFGISLTQDPQRPVLLLKAEVGDHTLPVALNPLEAGVTITQSHKHQKASTPHKVTELLLESLNMKIEKAIFVEIKNHHQYVRLYFENHPTHGSLKVRADEAMSLCLHLGTELFATPAFMAKSKVMNAEAEGVFKGLAMNPGVLARHHDYLM